MSVLNPTEKKFESHIEKYLNSIEYKSIHYEKYDRTLCLIKDEVLDFIKKTQKEKWDKLKDAYGEEVENFCRYEPLGSEPHHGIDIEVLFIGRD